MDFLDVIVAIVPLLIFGVVGVLFVQGARHEIAKYKEQIKQGLNPFRPIAHYMGKWIGILLVAVAIFGIIVNVVAGVSSALGR